MNGSKAMILASLIFGVGFGLVIVYIFFRSPVIEPPLSPSITETHSSLELPLPTSSPLASPNSDLSWQSPEGKKTLTMKQTAITNGQKTFSFFESTTATPSTDSGHLVFTRTIPSTSTMSIPFNSWSPGNQFFFVQENDGSLIQNFVLKSTGEPFSNKENVLNVNEQFGLKNEAVIFGEATGWAAPSLLIVNSKTTDSKQGPSFWFDVNRLTFTRLSTKF